MSMDEDCKRTFNIFLTLVKVNENNQTFMD